MQLLGHNLACERGGRLVFRDIDFCLRSGQLLQLTGPNGSGKSSLLRLIAGLNEPQAGTLTLDGGHSELSVAQQCHLIAHQDAVKPAMSVGENLTFWSNFLGGGGIDSALVAFDLHRIAALPAALLSAGQKRRLALSRLVAVQRVLWLLDEPTVGLDTASLDRLAVVMANHLDVGGMIIAATHTPLGRQPDCQLALGRSP